MNTRNIVLDVSKEPEVDLRQKVVIAQGDVGGTTIAANITDNGVALTLTGLSARFVMRVPKSRSYVRDGNCTVSGSTITYVVDEEHCATFSGTTDEAYFEVIDSTNNVIASTTRFPIHVLRSAIDGAEPSPSWDSEIDEVIERADEVLDEIEAIADDLPMPATATPIVDGTAAVGSSLKYAREDHVHPTDTTRAAASDIPVAATATPLVDGAAAVGSSTKWAKEDHVHPTDTSRASASDPALSALTDAEIDNAVAAAFTS